MNAQQCSYPPATSMLTHCYRTAKYLVAAPGGSYEPYCGIHLSSIIAKLADAEAREHHAGSRNPVLVLPVD